MKEKRQQILEAGSRGAEVSLKGIVVSDELDALFNTISILLSTNEELDLSIERDAKGDELFNHIRALVAVKGFIREDQPGKWMIRITDYEVLVRNAK
ncbi:MAG: hypothetical protein JEZ02_11375 [Desulfatibacillum sp.]|nr:hypothetical protein [Desulfatibacillum sp.]